MKKLCLILLLILFVGAGIVYAASVKTQGDAMNKKVLIAYFSWSGNTQSIAEKIHTQVGGDIFEITPVTPHPKTTTKALTG